MCVYWWRVGEISGGYIMDKAVELDLCADEAYLKTIEASIDREESIDKLLASPSSG